MTWVEMEKMEDETGSRLLRIVKRNLGMGGEKIVCTIYAAEIGIPGAFECYT